MVASDLRSIPSRLSGANFCNAGRPDDRPGMLAMSISARHHLGVLGSHRRPCMFLLFSGEFRGAHVSDSNQSCLIG